MTAAGDLRPQAAVVGGLEGRIVEDYSAFDSLELLKQLGVWRTVLAAPRMLRALRDGRGR